MKELFEKQLGVKENRKKDYEYKNEVIETEKAIEANPDIQKPELKFAFTDKVKEIEEEIKLLKEKMLKVKKEMFELELKGDKDKYLAKSNEYLQLEIHKTKLEDKIKLLNEINN
jgi:hypothetical protein